MHLNARVDVFGWSGDDDFHFFLYVTDFHQENYVHIKMPLRYNSSKEREKVETKERQKAQGA